MFLKYNKSLKDSVLTVTVSLNGNTTEETRAIRQLGAPMINLVKDYPTSGTAVDINKSVVAFTDTQVFTGTPDTLQDVIAEGQEYILDIKEKVTEAMIDLLTRYSEILSEVSETSGTIKIETGSVLSGTMVIED
jgi:hypothetical protein